MEDLKRLAEKLGPLERDIFPLLRENAKVSDVIRESGLKEVEVMRALRLLDNKKIIELKSHTTNIVSLGKNGEKYAKNGLPEKGFLNSLSSPKTRQEIKKSANLNDDELNVCIGLLKRLGAIEIRDKVSITSRGRDLIGEKGYENLLNSLPKDIEALDRNEKAIIDELKRRKDILKLNSTKKFYVQLNDLARRLSQIDIPRDTIEAVTPEVLKSNIWMEKKFRRYDVLAEIPRIYPAKLHIVTQAANYIKRIWLDMGFKEAEGNLVETSFWDFDALFVPQDHPARDMQDTFFINKYGNLPEKSLVTAVAKEHESSWKYKWNKEDAKRLLLRTHTTPLSAKALANLKVMPAKIFTVGKVFRNEVLDWSHLFEFFQSEGIVVDENANFRHLLAYLRKFFEKMGFERVRFRPSYYPYTECSVDPEIYHPVHNKWIELGGAGIFRPEVVKPLLGKDIPVLAWGLGLDRIIMDSYGFHDVRDLYKNDLKILRGAKLFMK